MFLFAWPAAAADTTCAETEKTVFECTTKHHKVIAVCASADGAASPWLQYRYGRPDKVELAWPTELEGSRAKFSYAFEIYARSMGVTLTFQNGDTTYTVYDQDTYGSELDHGAGVNVTHAGKVTSVACDDDGGLTLELESLATVVPHGPTDKPKPF